MRGSCAERQRLRGARGARDRAHDLAAGLGRDALEGGRRRHGDRGGHRDGDLQRPREEALAGGARAASRGARASARARGGYSLFKLWLKYAKPARGTLVVDAGAARALREGGAQPAAGGHRGGARQLPGGRRGRDRASADAATAACGLGKGICNYSAAELRAGEGHEVRRPCASSAARRRGGRAPRLPGRWTEARPYAGDTDGRDPATQDTPADGRDGHTSGRHIGRRHLPRRQARRADARARRHRTSRTRRSRRSPRRCSSARERDPAGQRARHGGGRARRSSATRCSTGCAWTRSASRGSRAPCGRSSRCPTRWAR